MRYTLEELTTFIHVVEAQSISEAARRMGLSKSVVSKRLTDLEDALGATLLRRSTRKVGATEGGLAFYQRARQIVRDLDEAVAVVSDRGTEISGTLRITAPMSFGTMYLAPLVFAFAQQHPRLEVVLDLDDRVTDILGQGYDLAIRIGQLRDSSLVARKLTTIRRVVCCSPEYATRHGRPRSVTDLADHACIGYANVPTAQLWQFEGMKKGRPLLLRSRITANNGEAIRDAAVAGLGLALLPAFIAVGALCDGRLIDALPSARATSYTLCAVYPRRRHPPRALRALIDHLAEALRDAPWEQELRAAERSAR